MRWIKYKDNYFSIITASFHYDTDYFEGEGDIVLKRKDNIESLNNIENIPNQPSIKTNQLLLADENIFYIVNGIVSIKLLPSSITDTITMHLEFKGKLERAYE